MLFELFLKGKSEAARTCMYIDLESLVDYRASYSYLDAALLCPYTWFLLIIGL